MPIEYDLNTLKIQLDKPENKELGILIAKDLRYLLDQSRRVHSHQKEYLFLSTVLRLIKIMNEYPMMIDGRNNQSNNKPSNEPF